MAGNHPLGYCPACLHGDRNAMRQGASRHGDVGYLDELPDGSPWCHAQECDTCGQIYPSGAAVTAARRSLAAEAGWTIRRHKFGPSGRPGKTQES